MGLTIFVVFISTMIVLMLFIALGRISFSSSMVIMGILLLISFILLSLFVPLKTILKTLGFFLGIAIFLGGIAYCIASGATSLLWWAGRDTTPLEKEKTKTCSECRTENMLGRLFCVKCGKQFIKPTDVKDLKISSKASAEEHRNRLQRKIKNLF